MRNDKSVPVLGVLCVALLIGGCARQTLGEDFGKSSAINLAAQVVNPVAGAPGDAPVINTVDGQKVEKALERYRADRPEASRAKLLSEMGN